MAVAELQEMPVKLSFPRDVSGLEEVVRRDVQIQGVTSFVRLIELLEA